MKNKPNKSKPKNLSLRQKALKILGFALEKKASDPVILDVRDFALLSDFFIICSADSQRQAKAIFENVISLSKKNKIDVHHKEDDLSSRWFLIDYFDVVIHIFDHEARNFYALENLWREAKKISIPKKLLEEK